MPFCGALSPAAALPLCCCAWLTVLGALISGTARALC